jgi:hypothetical protein
MEAASGALLAALATRKAGAASPVSAGTRSYCFFSKHLPDLNWTDLAAATIEMGFDGIDLTVRPKGHVAPERVAEDLPRALDAIRAKGTSVSMITTELTSASHPTANAIFAAAGKAGIKLAKVGYWKYALKDVRAEVAAMGSDLAGLAQVAKQHGVRLLLRSATRVDGRRRRGLEDGDAAGAAAHEDDLGEGRVLGKDTKGVGVGALPDG